MPESPEARQSRRFVQRMLRERRQQALPNAGVNDPMQSVRMRSGPSPEAQAYRNTMNQRPDPSLRARGGDFGRMGPPRPNMLQRAGQGLRSVGSRAFGVPGLVTAGAFAAASEFDRRVVRPAFDEAEEIILGGQEPRSRRPEVGRPEPEPEAPAEALTELPSGALRFTDRDNQVVTSIEDERGGRGEVRMSPEADRGLRRGRQPGGTVSGIDLAGSTAAMEAAAPIRRENALRRSQLRGDIDARRFDELMAMESMSPAERVQFRRQLELQGIADRGAGSRSLGERARGRLARQELQQTQAQAQAAGLRPQDQIALARLERDLRRDQASDRRDRTEELRRNRAESREILDRATTDRDGNIDTRARNQLEAFMERTGVSETDTRRVRLAADAFALASQLDREAEVSSGIPILGWFSRDFPQRETPEETLNDLAELAQIGVDRQQRTRRGAPGLRSRDVVTWRGQELNLNQLSPQARERFSRLTTIAAELMGDQEE